MASAMVQALLVLVLALAIVDVCPCMQYSVT
jgi:hypothetical protein